MNEYSATEQPDPIQNEKPAVWELVIQDVTELYPYNPDAPPHSFGEVTKLLVDDMKDRDAWGRSKYKTPLQPFNGRDALIDLYQELLDAVVYAAQYKYELENSTLPNAFAGDTIVIVSKVYKELLGTARCIKGRLLGRDYWNETEPHTILDEFNAKFIVGQRKDN